MGKFTATLDFTTSFIALTGFRLSPTPKDPLVDISNPSGLPLEWGLRIGGILAAFGAIHHGRRGHVISGWNTWRVTSRAPLTPASWGWYVGRGPVTWPKPHTTFCHRITDTSIRISKADKVKAVIAWPAVHTHICVWNTTHLSFKIHRRTDKVSIPGAWTHPYTNLRALDMVGRPKIPRYDGVRKYFYPEILISCVFYSTYSTLTNPVFSVIWIIVIRFLITLFDHDHDPEDENDIERWPVKIFPSSST